MWQDADMQLSNIYYGVKGYAYEVRMPCSASFNSGTKCILLQSQLHVVGTVLAHHSTAHANFLPEGGNKKICSSRSLHGDNWSIFSLQMK